MGDAVRVPCPQWDRLAVEPMPPWLATDMPACHYKVYTAHVQQASSQNVVNLERSVTVGNTQHFVIMVAGHAVTLQHFQHRSSQHAMIYTVLFVAHSVGS